MYKCLLGISLIKWCCQLQCYII